MIKVMGFNEHAEETTSIKSIDEMKPTYCTACLICDEMIEEYGDPIRKCPVICDECKEAVKFAKWLRKKGSLPSLKGETKI